MGKGRPLSELLAKADKLIADGGPPKAPEPTVEEMCIHDLAVAVEERSSRFYGVIRVRSAFARLRPGDSAWTELRRAFWRMEATGLDQETYLEAQYDFFGRAFSKAPSLRQLGTPAAAIRAEEFAKKGREGRQAQVSPVVQRVKLTRQQVFDHEERVLQRQMVVWKKTEREILRIFGGPNAHFFDPRFLESKPAWRELRDAGELPE